jgi:hypothetical protein
MEGRSPVARDFEDDSSILEDRMSEAYVPLVVDISADLCAARGLDVLAGDESMPRDFGLQTASPD